jgi:hypothetical protein
LWITDSIFTDLPTPSASGNKNLCIPSDRKAQLAMNPIKTTKAGAEEERSLMFITERLLRDLPSGE